MRASPRARQRADQCFAPLARRHSHSLILGSLPGRRSLQLQQYYAHPRNSFWRIISRVFGDEDKPAYRQRIRMLTSRHIALWDVLAMAERPGSLDSSIVHASARANDFDAFFRAHPRIRRVFFNGHKAEELYRRFVLPALGPAHAGISYATLPSTSAAHAGMPFSRKLVRWRQIAERQP